MTVSKKVLVTGGAGFIGSHVVDELVAQGYEVTVIDNLSLGKKEFVHLLVLNGERGKFYAYDIRDYSAIRPFFDGVKCVFHLAAQPRIQPSIHDPLKSFHHNALGTMNVLTAAWQAKVPRFVFSGSSSVYGHQEYPPPYSEGRVPNPLNPYAQFKLDSERHCLMFHRLYGLPVVCLRYFNVYGERQSCEGAYATVVGIFLKQFKEGRPLTIVGDGEQSRDFTYVKDVVRANILAMDSPAVAGEVINIGSGASYSINEVAIMIAGLDPTKVTYLPPRLGEARATEANIDKAHKLLRWSPTEDLAGWLHHQVLPPRVLFGD